MKKLKKIFPIMLCFIVVAITFAFSACGDDEGCNHKWGDWENTGVVYCDGVEQVRTCSKCGEKENRSTSDGDYSLHVWNEWKTSKRVTCEVDGEEDRVCTKCPRIETRPVAKLGHSENTLVCTKCCQPLVTVPQLENKEYDSIAVKLTNLSIDVEDVERPEDSAVITAVKLIEAYVRVDENNNLVGYGNGILKLVAKNTGVEDEIEATIYLDGGYIYTYTDGVFNPSRDQNAPKSYNKMSLDTPDAEETKVQVKKVSELAPKVLAWYNDVLVPLFARVNLGTPASSAKFFIADTLNDFFTKTVNDNGTISYVLNFEEARHLVDVVFDETISSLIDTVLGEDTFKSISELVAKEETYAYSVSDLINYIQVEQGIDLKLLCASLDAIAVIALEDTNATFEDLIRQGDSDIPEDFDIYEYITSEEITSHTVREAVIGILGAPEEATNAELAEGVSDMLTMLGSFTVPELALQQGEELSEEELATAIENIKAMANDYIDMAEAIVEFELVVGADMSFKSIDLSVAVSEDVSFDVSIDEEDVVINANIATEDVDGEFGVQIIPGGIIDANQEKINAAIAPFKDAYVPTISEFAQYMSESNTNANEHYVMIDGTLYFFEVIDRSDYVQLRIIKFTGDFNEISIYEKCGGGYVYAVSMQALRTAQSYYNIYDINVEDLDLQNFDFEANNVEFSENSFTSGYETRFCYVFVDGKVEQVPVSEYYDACHDYVYNEELSTKSETSACGELYYNYYECTKCDDYYKSFDSVSHTSGIVYSYDNGIYTAKEACTKCGTVVDEYEVTFVIDSDITTEYYESNEFAGFTVTIDEETAGRYYLYGVSTDCKYIDTEVDVYVYEEGAGGASLTDYAYADGGADYGQFGTYIELEAGVTYLIAPCMYNSNINASGNITVCLEKQIAE